ncbi:MAG: FadR/GntR family transcriptional regulator [Intestinibacter sp.]
MNTKKTIPKIKKINLSEQITNSIIDLIESGQWKLEEKLPNEIDLAQSFDVSRNVMRESMKILTSYGILDSKTGVGTFVSKSALTSISNMRFFESLKNNSSIDLLLETRMIIEPNLTYYATLRTNSEDLKKLKKLLEQDINKHHDSEFFHENDFDFHAELAHFSKNPILENLLITILEQLKESDYNKFNQYVPKSVKDNSFNDHLRILSAMENKDAELAKNIMYEHLSARISIIKSSYNTK